MIAIVLAAVIVVALGAAAHGAFYRNSPVFGRVLGRLPRQSQPERSEGTAVRKQIALTFDDGPNPHTTPRILDALRDANVRATFFLLGRHVERWPDLAQRVATEGHAIGNHGYHHRKLHFRGPGYVRLDLMLGTATIEGATGERPAFFRAPHGFRSPWVSRIARGLGQRTVGWTLGVWDSDKPGADPIVRRSVDAAKPGMILLLHDGDGYDPAGDRTQTAEALPRIISELRAKGYEFVSLPA